MLLAAIRKHGTNARLSAFGRTVTDGGVFNAMPVATFSI
jgi:hypothetical protein